MLKTIQVFKYTFETGRDLFDDLEQLDRHEALYQLNKPNHFGFYLGAIMEGLMLAGVDVENGDVDLSAIMGKTYQPGDHEVEQDDDRDFIPESDLITRSRVRFPKNTVKTTIRNFIISKHLNDDVLLDSPFDIAVELYNDAIKEQNKQRKR